MSAVYREAALSTEIAALEERLAQLYSERGGLVISETTVGEGEVETVAWCKCGKNRVRPSEGQDTCDTCLVEA
jgi:hypothetical protein